VVINEAHHGPQVPWAIRVVGQTCHGPHVMPKDYDDHNKYSFSNLLCEIVSFLKLVSLLVLPVGYRGYYLSSFIKIVDRMCFLCDHLAYFEAYYYTANTIREHCCHLVGFLCNYNNTTWFKNCFC